MLLKMTMRNVRQVLWGCVLAICFPAAVSGRAEAQKNHPYEYFRTGSAADVAPAPTAGFALMGGGTDLDEAFLWLCRRANGGDFLILRASGDDDYNLYIQKLCPLNSVATLILPSRAAANDPFVDETIAHAEAIFIAGGDQANYVRYWTGTPVQSQINAAVRRGVPLGGTSAGLAVMGEWAYSAEGDKPDDPNLDSKSALMDPVGPRVTLRHGFLNIPALKGVITDTHFARRDRMGRLLVFLMRLNEPAGTETPPPNFPIRGAGIEQGAAVLVEPDGSAGIVGQGAAYFVGQQRGALLRQTHAPVTDLQFEVQKVVPGRRFNLNTWKGESVSYTLSVQAGKIHSSQAGDAAY